jgi:trimeric autotransporter adhesin
MPECPAGSGPMSGVGSVGSSSSDSLWYQLYLQSLQGASQASNSSSAAALLGSQPATTTSTATSSSGSDASGNNNGASGSNSSTVDLTDLRSQIETAVTNALNNASATDDPSDLLETVHNAVDATLQANGISPQQLNPQQHVHRHGGHHGHHHKAASDDSQSTNPASADGTTSDADGDSDGSSTSTGQGQDLLAILTQLGNQTNQPGGANYSFSASSASSQLTTLAAALSTSSATANGGLDLNSLFAQLFASFPSGSGLDVQV